MIELKLGTKNPLVSYLKQILQNLKIYTGEINDQFTQELEEAVKILQNEQNISIDGIVAEEVWEKILKYTFVPTNIPYTSDIVEIVVRGLKIRFPFIQTNTIGKSVMGTSIPSIILGTGIHKVLYVSTTHANEWITTPVLLKFIEELCLAYMKGEKIYDVNAKKILETSTIHIVPMINPDGVDLINGNINEKSQYYLVAQDIAKDYPSIPFPDGWKANIKGIDLNLQFPALWENAKEIKYKQGFTSPAPRDFVGDYPLQAPEAVAIYDLALSSNFSLMITYHTQGEVIYWKFQDYDPRGAEALGKTFSKASEYPLEDTPYNSSFAGYKDWFIQAFLKPGYTIEAGIGENPLPLSQFDKIYNDNIGILVIGASKVT